MLFRLGDWLINNAWFGWMYRLGNWLLIRHYQRDPKAWEETPDLIKAIFDAGEKGLTAPHQHFTCPRCGRVSHSAMDKQEGYCGACHDWTSVEESP